MVGKTISHYQILEKLGEGGMGVVYKARDTHLDRLVAIKVLPPEKVSDPDRKLRFVQEAKAASALNHPNIIHIYDIDEQDGVDYMVMEHIDGKTLDELIPHRGMRLSEALKHSVEIADALAKAHSAGIIHRDLKPGNVMVGEDGRVKVLDFGLAKLTEAVPFAEDQSTRTLKPATEEGKVVGTVSYMSPEQAEGKKVDARSDIFSFGSLLYEMVSGRRAFQKESKASTLGAIIHKEPEPLGIEVPQELNRIITRCLRKDPDKRFHHMVDLRVALAELKEESDSGKLAASPVARPASRRKLIWTTAILALLSVAGIAAWFVVASRQAPTPVLNPAPLTSFPGAEREPSFSPDGNQVAFSWNGEKQDNYDIYLMLVGGGRPLRLTSDPAEDFSPAWSPDGRSIAFLRSLPGGKAAVLLVPPLGGAERKLGEVYAPTSRLYAPHLAWSPAGGSLAVIDKAAQNESAGLFLLSVETGEKLRLTSPPSETAPVDNGPAFSQDGASLVFSRRLSAGVSDLFSLELAPDGKPAGEPRRLTFGNWNAASPAWAGRSDVVFSAAGEGRSGLWRIAPSERVEPARVPLDAEGARTLAISPSSHRLVFNRSMDDSNIWRVELANGRISGPSISSTRTDYCPQYSPDGKRIAFASSRSGDSAIWVSDSDGSNAVQLTSRGAFPTWSPDGQRIAFHTNEKGQIDVYVVGAGGGKPVRLTDHPGIDWYASWSRDGRWIYFFSTRSGAFEIWKIPIGPGNTRPQAVQVTRRGGHGPVESPDGKWLYYTKAYPVSGLWRMPVEGGEEVQILEARIQIPFAVFDDGIYYLKPTGATALLQFLDLATRRITSIATTEKPSATGLTVSPDPRWALFTQIDQQGSDLMLVENFR